MLGERSVLPRRGLRRTAVLRPVRDAEWEVDADGGPVLPARRLRSHRQLERRAVFALDPLWFCRAGDAYRRPARLRMESAPDAHGRREQRLGRHRRPSRDAALARESDRIYQRQPLRDRRVSLGTGVRFVRQWIGRAVQRDPNRSAHRPEHLRISAEPGAAGGDLPRRRADRDPYPLRRTSRVQGLLDAANRGKFRCRLAEQYRTLRHPDERGDLERPGFLYTVHLPQREVWSLGSL